MLSLKDLLMSIFRSGGILLLRKYPLPYPKHCLAVAVKMLCLSGKTVSETVRDTLDGLRRRVWSKSSLIEKLQSSMTQAAMAIDISVRERGLEAVTAPQKEVLYRLILSHVEQIGNASRNFGRHLEANPTRGQGLYAPRSVRRAA